MGIKVTYDMGGCQNDGPFLGPYYNTAPNPKHRILKKFKSSIDFLKTKKSSDFHSFQEKINRKFDSAALISIDFAIWFSIDFHACFLLIFMHVFY